MCNYLRHKSFILIAIFSLIPFSCKSIKRPKGVQPVEKLIHVENGKYFIISDIQGRQYLLDTGSSGSYLDADVIQSLRKNDYQSKTYASTVNQQKGFKTERVKALTFSSFIIKNSRFTHFPADSPIRSISNKLVGVLGMNILGEQISYWNIKENTFILGYKAEKIDTPILILRYQNASRVPIVDIRVNDIQCDNVLMDTGYYNFLRLHTYNASKFKSEYFISQNNDMLGNKTQTTTYNLNSIIVDGCQLREDAGFRISLGDFDKDLLGSEFFAYWDYFILDPMKKEFRFYKK